MRTHLNKTIFAIAALAMLSIAACNKNNNPEKKETEIKPKEVTTENIAGSYAVTKVEGRTPTGQRSDITTTWFSNYGGDCAKDDVTTFKPDNSFVVLDGTIECDESTDDNGTWKLVNATQLKIDMDTAAIEEFNSTTLRIVSPVYSSAQRDVIFTYTRQ